MEKYRKKQEILVLKWTGKETEVEEFNELLKPFNVTESEKFYVIQALNHKEILCLVHKLGGGTSTYYVNVGEYAIFDIGDTEFPFSCKTSLEEYVKI